MTSAALHPKLIQHQPFETCDAAWMKQHSREEDTHTSCAAVIQAVGDRYADYLICSCQCHVGVELKGR